MTRALLAVALLGASYAASACPICLGAGQPTRAQELVAAQQVVLAVPTADKSRYRVIEVIKGERPPRSTIEGDYPRIGSTVDAPVKQGRALLLVRADPFPTWVILGAVSTDRSGWLRQFAMLKRFENTSANDWQARLALVLPHLESGEALLAEIAYGEAAAAPYAAMRAARARIDARAVRLWLADVQLTGRHRLYMLLLGLAGDTNDAVALEQRLDAARKTGDATNLASMLAADLELRGATRVAWIETTYLRDRASSTPEVTAALLALSVHGNAGGVIPRERVIQAYRVFMKAHPEIAGYVAEDLAAWQYWEAVPEYVALIGSGALQQLPSRIATLAYLRQSPSADARELALKTSVLPGARP